MRNDSNYNDIYVNQVQVRSMHLCLHFYYSRYFSIYFSLQLQLPPSQSQLFYNVQPLTASQISQIIDDRRLPISPDQNLGQPPTYNEAIRTPNIERKIEEKNLMSRSNCQ